MELQNEGEVDARPEFLTLRGPRAAGWWWNGRGVQGPRYEAQSARGAEVPAT